jgi:hypothetical protein
MPEAWRRSITYSTPLPCATDSSLFDNPIQKQYVCFAFDIDLSEFLEQHAGHGGTVWDDRGHVNSVMVP